MQADAAVALSLCLLPLVFSLAVFTATEHADVTCYDNDNATSSKTVFHTLTTNPIIFPATPTSTCPSHRALKYFPTCQECSCRGFRGEYSAWKSLRLSSSSLSPCFHHSAASSASRCASTQHRGSQRRVITQLHSSVR